MNKLILSGIFFFYISHIKAEEKGISIQKEVHDYIILSMDEYTSYNSVQGINLSSKSEYFTFSLSETSVLISSELNELKNGSYKKINSSKNMIVSTIDNNTFYSGRKKISFLIEPGISFEINYSTTEKNTIFLASLYKSGYYESIEANYTFQLPDDLTLTARNKEKFTTSLIKIDSTFYPDSIDYIPFIIHPKSQDINVFFSDWFMSKIQPISKISPSLIPESLIELSKEGKTEKLAKACFQLVQDKVKYLDIENGLNAVIPRSCDYVFNNQLGDCKDMANLIVGLLTHFGFEAYHGISRTYSKSDTLNFPSIGLGNHMIAVLRLNNQWIFLDGTENACLFGDPSVQILGTEVLLLEKKSNQFLKVPNELRYNSTVKMNYVIQKPVNQKSKLTLEIICSGKMNYRFYSKLIYNKMDTNSFQTSIQEMFKLKWKLVDFSVQDSLSIIHLSVDLPSSSYSMIGTKQLLNQNFLLSPEEIGELFYLTEYPLYESTISYSIQTEGNLSKELEKLYSSTKEFHLAVKNNQSLSLFLNFKSQNSEESFTKSDLIKEWKTYISKPLSITYEQL